MSKIKRQGQSILRSSVALVLTAALIFLSVLLVCAEGADNPLIEGMITASGTANMFSTPVNDGVEYNTSALSLEKLPKYMDDVLGLREVKEGKKPVSLSMEDADELTSITTVNEDGTHTLYLFDTPIKYVDNGNIKFIDNTIKKVSNASGGDTAELSSTLLTPITNTSGYTNAANCFDVNMPSSINQGVSLEYGDLKVSIFPSSLSSAKATLKTVGFRGTTEQVVEYRDVFGSGTHLQYVPTNKGIKENIVLDKYSGVNTFNFTINTGDYYPLYTEGEAIPFVDPSTDKITFILGQVDARDSYTGDDTDGHFTLYNSLSLTKIKDGIYSLTVTIDPEFLTNKNTVYPVIIDPSVTLSSGIFYDTTVYSGKPDTQTFYSSAYNIVGYHGSSYGTGIAMIKTKMLSDYTYINAHKITAAYYRAYEGSGKTNSSTIRVYGPSVSWLYQSVTYNNMPEYDNGRLTTKDVKNSGWYNFDVTRHIVDFIKYATDGSGRIQDRGWALEAANPEASSKHFCSADYNGSYAPSIIINYSTAAMHDITATYNSSGNYPFKAWGSRINGESPLLKFRVAEEGMYVVETMSSTYFAGTQTTDTTIQLYDSSFNRRGFNDNTSTESKYSRLRIRLTPGIYYVLLSGKYEDTGEQQIADNLKCYVIIEKEGEIDTSTFGLTYPDGITTFYKIEDSSNSYNCFGYVVGDLTLNEHVDNVLYPSDTQTSIVDKLARYETTKGYSIIYETKPASIKNCIVVYGFNQYNIMHIARMKNGIIYSKVGCLEVIAHVQVNVYFNGSYGDFVAYIVDPNESQ